MTNPPLLFEVNVDQRAATIDVDAPTPMIESTPAERGEIEFGAVPVKGPKGDPGDPGSINVKDFGAKGDGSTNDTGAIQSAIDTASAAGGGRVFFPVGTYRVVSLTLKSYVSLTGAVGAYFGGQGSIIKTTATAGDILAYSDSNTGLKNASIENLRLEGPYSGSGNGIRLQNTGGSSKPNLNVNILGVKVIGFGGAGIEAACLITSSWQNVTVESCATGFFLNGGTNFANVCTSMTLINCYANACATYGFRLLSTVYSTLIAPAADDCGTAYLFDTCNNLTVTSPGAEWGAASTASPYDGYKFVASAQITLASPYTYRNKHFSYWVTAGSKNIVLIAPAENSPNAPTNSLKTDASTYTTVIAPDFTTARSLLGNTLVLNDGGGAIGLPTYGTLNNGTTKVLELGNWGAANYIGIESAPTGSPADIYAAGSDTNIDLALTPKGTGRVTAKGAPVVTGTVAGSSTPLILWKGTQVQYDALGTKDPNTIYAVTP